MSSAVPPPRRTVVLRANRDTLVLLAATAGLTVAIGYAAKNHPSADPSRDQISTGRVAADGWTGTLAQLEPRDTPAPVEPLSSAALTVPKASMALPNTNPPPATRTQGAVVPRQRPCDATAPCPSAGSAVGQSPGKTASARRPTVPTREVTREAGLLERLNPLDHLPDAVKRPFASAGDAIAGWVKRF